MADDRVAEPVFDGWGWEAHQMAQRRRAATRPLVEKIAWLEEAHRLVLVLNQRRKQRNRRPRLS